MARIKIELEDTDDGCMNFKIDADGLATYATRKTNTCVQNSAILLIQVLKDCGIDKGKLPNLINLWETQSEFNGTWDHIEKLVGGE